MIVDLGAGTRPDDRADYAIDKRGYDGIDCVSDLREPWPLADGSAEGLVASHLFEHFSGDELAHAFREAARVLRPGGWLEVTTPVGINWHRDPTHETLFTWTTFEFFDRDHKWAYWDLPLSLADRTADVWVPGGGRLLSGAVRRVFGRTAFKDQLVASPWLAGEVTARYRRCPA